MTDITIYLPSGDALGRVPITEACKLDQELMKTDQVELSWRSAVSERIPMGAYIVHPVSGIQYYLDEPYYPEAKEGSGVFQYKPIFKHELMMLAKVPFLFYSTDSSGNTTIESDWNFTGKGADLMTSLSTAIYNGIGTRYTIEIAPEIEKALSLQFANVDILTAMNNIAQFWECEWWTDEQTEQVSTAQKVIHFGTRCVHFGGGSEPYPLTAGRNITAPNSNQKSTFYNRFYVFGSTRNIPQDYNGAQANHIVNKRLTLNPSKYPSGYIDLPVFNEDGEAQVDERGNLISAINEGDRIFTKVLQFDDIYPKSNCRIKKFTKFQRYVTDSNGNKIELANGEYDSWYVYVVFLEYQDAQGNWQPFTINKSTYDPTENPDGSLIKGLTLSLHFSSGALEGREFEASYNATGKEYRNENEQGKHTVGAGSFELIKIEDNTIILPNPSVEPKASTTDGVDEHGSTIYNHDGDECIVFNIRMPQQYYDTAYTELEAKAIEQIYEDTKDSNQYSVKSNPVAFANEQPNLTLGRVVNLSVGGRVINTRVAKLSTHLDRPIEQDITLSKGLAKGTISTLLQEVTTNRNKITEVSVKDTTEIKLTKQAIYKALEELNDEIFDPDGYFTDKINPLTIKTYMLSVGAISGNFQLENIVFYPNYNDDADTFYIASNNGKLVHYGINPDATLPTEWSISGSTIDITELDTEGDAHGVWYLYAQCSRSASGGTFVLSQEQIRYDSNEQFYYFLIGTLGSKTINNTDASGNNVYVRVLSTTYGTTTINGRLIQTGRIQSTDGRVWIDLDKGEIGGNIVFTGGQDAQTYINNIVNDKTADIADQVASQIPYVGVNLCVGSIGNNINPFIATGGLISIPSQTIHGHKAVRFTSNNDSTNFFYSYKKVDISKINIGDTITISAWVMANVTGTQNFRYILRFGNETNDNIANIGGYITTTFAQWKHISLTGVVPQSVANATRIQLFFTVEHNGHWLSVSELKVEKGSIATDWTPAPEDTDYLTEAITNGSTLINGGLVLGNIIGVSDTSSSGFKAGMSGMGNSDSSPRFWAGKNINADGTITDAPFMVQQDGTATLSKAKITANDGSNSIKITDGSISLIEGTNPDNGAELTVISPAKVTSIDNALSILNPSMGTLSLSGGSINTEEKTIELTIAAVRYWDFSALLYSNSSEWQTILSSSKGSGSITIPAQAVTLGNIYIDWKSATLGSGTYGNGGFYKVKTTAILTRTIRVGSSQFYSDTADLTNTDYTRGSTLSYAIAGGSGRGTATGLSNISIPARTFNVSNGVSVQIRYTYSVKIAGYWNEVLYNNTIYAHKLTLNIKTAKFTVPSCTPTGYYTAYNNRILANAFIQSQNSRLYWITSAVGKVTGYYLWRWRQGEQMGGITDGVQWIGTASSSSQRDAVARYPANPLILIVRVMYSNGDYTIDSSDILFNPRNLTIPKPSRIGTGTITFTHNIGHTQYTLCGTAVDGNRGYVSFHNKTNTSCTVTIGDDGSPNDFSFEIMVFDYKTI